MANLGFAPSQLGCALNHHAAFCLSIGEGNGNQLQYSCLENPMDGGAWWAAVYGVAKSQTQLSDFTFTFHFHALEKEMATHSSVLAWRTLGTGEPGGLPSMFAQSRTRLKWLSRSSSLSMLKFGITVLISFLVVAVFLFTLFFLYPSQNINSVWVRDIWALTSYWSLISQGLTVVPRTQWILNKHWFNHWMKEWEQEKAIFMLTKLLKGWFEVVVVAV